ncbi:amidase [Siminovitchia terrae]|uniref:amidase n=1 Tax=Siminovitchia terrae TaxID=1914933 RepID=UPI0028B015B6|nr:amidase [Siminovitchia terrae]
MSELLFDTIDNTSRRIAEKDLSPVELTKLTIERIRQVEPALNAFITVSEEQALEQAKMLEKEAQQGNIRSPLHGVPIAVKDMVQTKDILTTGGSKVFENWVPDEDAAVVRHLKEAGAVIIGKANLHEFAMGATTENPHYGNTRNPWNGKYIPGGSSGGSAVATAAGMAFGAIGTDTAGSIRLPAAMCGTAGIKPTYDLISREGSLPFSWSLDHVGPMTRTIKDSALMLEAMIGSNGPKSAKVGTFKELYDLKGIKLGFYEPYMYSGIDPDVKSVIEKAFQQWESLGAEIIPIELPFIDSALEGLKTIAQSEVVAYHEPLLKKHGDLYGDDLKYRFQYGRDISATAYISAQRVRKKFIQSTLTQMKGIDALIGPTNVQPPFEIGTMVPEQAISNMFVLGKTPLANILGFPALSVACGFTKDHFPVGLQLIGKPFSDHHIMEIADCYERSESWTAALKENKSYLELNHS